MSLNYQLEMEKILQNLPDQKKRLLLHSCCAPCSSYVLEYLRQYFAITVFYFNPNISEESEYRTRVIEQKRLIAEMNASGERENEILIMEGDYEPNQFFHRIKGLEGEKEGGARCTPCFELRLFETARIAAEGGYDFFTTTLSISPLKNAVLLNEIASRASDLYQVSHLPSDFKKKNGYKRSVELSKEHELYRQDYCGCIFSKMQREEQLPREETIEENT